MIFFQWDLNDPLNICVEHGRHGYWIYRSLHNAREVKNTSALCIFQPYICEEVRERVLCCKATVDFISLWQLHIMQTGLRSN